MKTYTAIVKGQSIEKNRDGEDNVRMLQVEITEPNDVQKVQWVGSGNDDEAPINEDLVFIMEISQSYKFAIGIVGSVIPVVKSGERKIYSRNDNGDLKASAYFKKDGDLIINEGTKGGARLDDAIKSTTVEDSVFWAWAVRYNTFNAGWITALATLQATGGTTAGVLAYSITMQTLLATLSTMPQTLTGKIIESSNTVKVGD